MKVMENERKIYHLINDLPHIYELEDMIRFCRKHGKIYIYGRGVQQELLLKYLDMCRISVSGYVVTVKKETDDTDFHYRKMPVHTFESVKDDSETGLLLALPDRYYGQIIPMFRKNRFENYFIMTEFNKRSIACQVRPRKKEELTFEVSLVDHCNLSCQMCDHYSQLSDPWFVDMDQFERDMIRMGSLCEHRLACISLLGGEPTLHPHIMDCMRITREQFPDTEIIILTNGTLLVSLEESEQGNFWQVCRKYDIHITVTVYPIRLDYEAIERKAAEYGVTLALSSDVHAKALTRDVKISDKHTLDLSGSVDRFYCINCLYFNKFCVLKDGKIYMCPVAAHSDIFNKHFGQHLELAEEDYLDIYQIDSWRQIAEFSCQYVPFCSYCDLKHWGHHSEWKASSREIDEYV